ncbi:MAG: hypothetical protein ACOX1A_03725 [Saccharofermentanales bacterium]
MFDQEDVKKGKPIAVIMYIISILFFLPLVADEYKNAYGKFHANQALLILLMQVISSVLAFTFVVPLIFGIAALIFIVLGIISAVNGTNTPLPIIGTINLINH